MTALVWCPFPDEESAAAVADLHPYDVPAVVGWRCDAAAPATAEWLAGLTRNS